MQTNIKISLVLLVPALMAACATTPERAASGCQDISGIMGREFRWSIGARSNRGGDSIDLGSYIGSTLPQISQEFRETLLMGDHLCRAAELGLIDPDIYESFMSAQLDGIGRVAQEQGGRSKQEVDSALTAAFNDVLAAAPPRVGRELRESQTRQSILPAGQTTPFQLARSIYAGVQEQLPPNVSAPYESAMYQELRARLEDLSDRIDALPNFQDVLGSVYFSVNSSDLDAVSRREIAAIVRAVGPGAKFRLEGFADPSGSYEHNRVLSEARANAVAAYLAELGAGSVVTTIGFGRTDQFGDAAANRRVIIQRLPE